VRDRPVTLPTGQQLTSKNAAQLLLNGVSLQIADPLRLGPPNTGTLGRAGMLEALATPIRSTYALFGWI